MPVSLSLALNLQRSHQVCLIKAREDRVVVVNVKAGLEILLTIDAVLEGDQAYAIGPVPVQEEHRNCVGFSDANQALWKAKLLILEHFGIV